MGWIDLLSNGQKISVTFGDSLMPSDLEVYEVRISRDRNAIDILTRTSVCPVVYPKRWDAKYKNSSITIRAQLVKEFTSRISGGLATMKLDLRPDPDGVEILAEIDESKLRIICGDVSIHDVHQF